MLVGNEVADALFDVFRCLFVFFRQSLDFFLSGSLIFHEAHQLVGQVFVEDEAKDVVFVFVGLDLGAHLVGGLPDLGSELLLVHVV